MYVTVQPDNTLLRAIPEARWRRLGGKLAWHKYERGQALQGPEDPLDNIIFPLRGVVSLLFSPHSGKHTEVAMVGNEGFVGVPLLIHSERTLMLAVAQTEGEAVSMDADTFLRCLSRLPNFASLARRYAQALLIMLGQGSACNSTHIIDRRCARWILAIHDRANGYPLRITQEALSRAMGVRRASVGRACRQLERQGLIAYGRARLTVVNRAALENFACPCYRIVKSEFERLLPEHVSRG